GRWGQLLREGDLHVGDCQLVLIDYEGGHIGAGGSKSYLPRPLACAPMLDCLVKKGIKTQSQKKRQNKVLERVVGFHRPQPELGKGALVSSGAKAFAFVSTL